MTRQLSWASKLIPTTAPLAVGNKQTFLFSSGKGVTGKMQSSDSDIPIMGSAQQHRHQLSRVFHSLRHQLGNRQTTVYTKRNYRAEHSSASSGLQVLEDCAIRAGFRPITCGILPQPASSPVHARTASLAPLFRKGAGRSENRQVYAWGERRPITRNVATA